MSGCCPERARDFTKKKAKIEIKQNMTAAVNSQFMDRIRKLDEKKEATAAQSESLKFIVSPEDWDRDIWSGPEDMERIRTGTNQTYKQNKDHQNCG